MSFSSTLDSFVKFSKEMVDSNIDVLRAEYVVESLKDWSELGDINSVKEWFISQQKQCVMVIEDIPLFECEGWAYDHDTGVFAHESGEFFYVQGVRVKNTKGREVIGGWDQPIITQVGFNGGLLGLLRKKVNGIPYYLVEAKAEPGNPDRVQISPTLQATFSNLKQAHGGRKPRFADIFEDPMSTPGSKVLFDQWMSEDGGRLHLKRNKGMIVEVNNLREEGELPASFKWLSLFQLKKLIKENSWVSPHIRGLISHL